MSLPASEPIPMPEEELPPARRRRLNRMVLPEDGDEQSARLDELGKRAIPGAEFYLSALLAGLVAGLGFWLDSPALVILAALLVPFMGPLMGLAVATVAGSVRFLLRSLGSLMIAAVIFLLTGTLAGWGARLFPPVSLIQAGYQTRFTWPDAALLTVGVVVTLALMNRSPSQRPLVSSVAVAYTVFLPLSAAGFGLTSGVLPGWEMGLVVFLAHLIWGVLCGTLTLVFLGFRPLRFLSYALTGGYALLCLAGGLVYFLSSEGAVRPPPSLPAALPPVLETPTAFTGEQSEQGLTPLAEVPSQTPSPTVTLTPTATHTLVPTRTPTVTLTPAPTPVYARINARGGNGAFIRAEPRYDALIVVSMLNGNVVEVLEDVTVNEGVTWVKVRTADGKEGWIVRELLATATPAPGW
ncbi:MAG TPA: DUF389 domain-containing protein [Anaerolinea thermolimosa]|uniref:DUF389 domain-containing protein n=1 Tax=Anaerolinea thermolimosa TaxID=229919 RepID=A0A3D1JGH3_9CHLR|nr:SH3 domain-containing protein [Anaerolinea thermolimosa]GAP08666.1 predicted membrane protein [Anaerolinea thermolimosa]HCE17679.1 DUF389 domain-containing protein [Anaerolinea thermolimosa]